MKVATLGRDLDTGNEQLWFDCPGCQSPHRVPVCREGKRPGCWKWNGSLEAPTLEPSVNHPGICHFFMREGVIEFCADSIHDKAGMKVPMTEYDG